tara:strand:+ start:36 stop:632 length:597 start_codon:yes stop_codon:yes gene_type:complete
MTQTINIKTNAKQIQKQLGRKYKKHLPKATEDAINATAFKLRKTYIAQAKQKFDNPTSFTLNAFVVKQATLKKLTAKVFIKDNQNQAKYLAPQIEGGISRRHKGSYVVPVEGTPLNKQGNLKFRKNIKGAGRHVRKTKTGWGLYSKGTKNKPSQLLAVFKKIINYDAIFPFYKIGFGLVERTFPKKMKEKLKYHMKKK